MEKGYMFGEYVSICGEATIKVIKKARKTLVKNMCREIKRLAKDYPEEFFIEKDCRQFPVGVAVYTVGAKLVVPNMPRQLKRKNEV